MSITAIPLQPVANSIHAAYRPVIITVTANDNTIGGGPTPPVVYCDIYFNDVFYKTLAKTQYKTLAALNSDWEFDLQDSAQEYLGKHIAAIAESAITEATPLVCKVLCRLRSSGFDTNGFIVHDGTAPIQGTSSSDPVAGTGTTSNTFYIVNATLQHQDIQDLAAHLTSHKKRTWTADALPLSHRPDGYALAPGDSDTFPIIYVGATTFKTLRLNYRYCNQTTFSQSSLGVGPGPVCAAIISTPVALHNDLGWLISWSDMGDVEPAKYYISTPAVSAGAPHETTDGFYQFGELAVGEHIVTVRPLCNIEGQFYFGAAKTVTITVAACVAVGIDGSPILPQAFVGIVYEYSFNLTGTAPFTLADITKPSWMTIEPDGNSIVFGGTPEEGDIGEDVPVSFTIENCSTDEIEFEGSVDVMVQAGNFIVENNTISGTEITGIDNITFAFDTGGFPILPFETRSGTHEGTELPIVVSITTSDPGILSLIINSELQQAIDVVGSDDYEFDFIEILETDDVMITLTP